MTTPKSKSPRAQNKNLPIEKQENKEASAEKLRKLDSAKENEYEGIVVKGENYSGPIPHPAHLAAYENIAPGLASRIVKMAEKELTHRIELTDKVATAEIKYRDKGLLYGLISLLALIGASLACAMTNHPKLAVAFIGVGFLGVAGRFIDGKRARPDEDDDKASDTPVNKKHPPTAKRP